MLRQIEAISRKLSASPSHDMSVVTGIGFICVDAMPQASARPIAGERRNCDLHICDRRNRSRIDIRGDVATDQAVSTAVQN